MLLSGILRLSLERLWEPMAPNSDVCQGHERDGAGQLVYSRWAFLNVGSGMESVPSILRIITSYPRRGVRRRGVKLIFTGVGGAHQPRGCLQRAECNFRTVEM